MITSPATTATPSSSASSRTMHACGVSPGSSLPPGNSQCPAMCRPGARRATSTRPSRSMIAAATWIAALGWSLSTRRALAVGRRAVHRWGSAVVALGEPPAAEQRRPRGRLGIVALRRAHLAPAGDLVERGQHGLGRLEPGGRLAAAALRLDDLVALAVPCLLGA